MKYLALLRGINVGGNNIIKMADLQDCFINMGFINVKTYIQSGNVIFETDNSDKNSLTKIIEDKLSTVFKYNSKIILVSDKELFHTVNEAPLGFGQNPEIYKYDFVFVKEPLTSTEVYSQLKLKDGVDEASYGKHALYFTRLTELSSRSYLTKLISLPVYKELSIRNFTTTTKLLELMRN